MVKNDKFMIITILMNLKNDNVYIEKFDRYLKTCRAGFFLPLRRQNQAIKAR